MSSVWSEFKNIERASIKQRVSAFRESTLEIIQSGTKIEDIEEQFKCFEEDELYEGVQGMSLAIKDFKKKPQLRLNLK